MIFFADVKLRAFLISSGAAFQSLVDEPIKLFLEFVEEPKLSVDTESHLVLSTFLLILPI
jgi:hypothetical protein